jgi:hypothetical protein
MWGKNGAVFISMLAALGGTAADLARDQVVKIVSQIQRADYEGDRAMLRRLSGDLKPFVEYQKLAPRARYWRGFALWRRAINGFNDNIDPKDLQEDLQLALDEFEAVAKTDAGFADAKIGALSCVGLLAFSVGQKDSARVQDLIARGRQLRKDAEAAEPDNPRLEWVLGPMLWNIPPERGGGQDKAVAAYQKGLDAIRKRDSTASDPLQPTWGEPELLMNLAWSNLNRTSPDLNAAEKYASASLELVPYWHYVRDILMMQIRDAKAKQN